MERITFKFNTEKLCELFDIEDAQIIEDSFIVEKGSSCSEEKNGFYGKTHTEETKLIISEKIKLLYKNPEFISTRKNFGNKNGMYGSARYGNLNPMYGKKQSEETKNKISEAAKKRYQSNPDSFKKPNMKEETKNKIAEKNSKQYELISPEGLLTTIKNLDKFARENNLNSACLRHVISGRNKSHKGWTIP